jgi:aryl-alcohol dehydrogenase-like predicted oxidoreductase
LPHNEELVGRALATQGRDAWKVVTKIGVDLAQKPPFTQSPEDLRAQLEASLAALGTDHVDVLVLNRPDPRRNIAETMVVFAEFVKEGKAKYLGLSEASEAEIRAAHAVTPISVIEGESVLPHSLCSRVWFVGIQR